MPTLAALAMLAVITPARAQTPPLAGDWLTANADTRVRIAPCGTNLCGVIVAVQRPGRDARNNVVALRGRDLVGIKLFDMKPTGGGVFTGPLYEHRSGRTYAGHVRLEAPDTLAVTGCLIENIACQTTRWARAR